MRLGVCIVTYQQRFAACDAFASLAALPAALRQHLDVVSACNAAPGAPAGAEPTRHVITDGPLPYVEVLGAENTGLAGGYNAGLRHLGARTIDAVLFLNADAQVPAWYLEWLLTQLAVDPAHDAFAPTLRSRSLQVSPFRKRGIGYPFYIIGYLCLRRSAFTDSLEFPAEFWLDGIDYWLSVRMHEAGLRTRIDPRTINHNLSVSDQFRSLPAWRYRNILASERRFLRWQRRPQIELAIVHARAMVRCLRFGRFDLARVVAQEFASALHD